MIILAHSWSASMKNPIVTMNRIEFIDIILSQCIYELSPFGLPQ